MVLSSMAPYKAPSLDGFQATFYQKTWDVMGDDIFNFVFSILYGTPIPRKLNETLLVLIPKVSHPELASQFRPISLCNVLYKMITKSIVNRLKNSLHFLVGLEQSSFIPGRQIVDNIVIY